MILGLLRIRNESRWIARVLQSIRGVCDEILVLDDHSTDDTAAICAAEGATVLASPFTGLDESRDKQWLLDRAYERIPKRDINTNSPHWALCIDGDEELMPGYDEIIRQCCKVPDVHAYSLQVLYLWDRADQMRIDGVYRDFRRPSLFRMMNESFRYQQTPFGNGANFHCSSIPQELLHSSRSCPAALLHWGYMNRADRLRKFEWYTRIDPDNWAEDGYRHMVIGDTFPAESRFRWGGPLQLARI